MKTPHLSQMARFTADSLPDLDEVTLSALELFAARGVPPLNLGSSRKPLVLGSGNAAATGRILFADTDAAFADESTYQAALASVHGIDGAVLISASGKKHAVSIAEDLKAHGLDRRLLTCNTAAPAAEFFDADRVFVFPKNREPYTYNTSTYMGMILAATGEDPASIHAFIRERIIPLVPGDLAKRFDAFYLLVPPKLSAIREMFLTKFDELFGPLVPARSFTLEQTKPAKTVVTTPRELFISFGCDNTLFGHAESRLEIPLPPNAGYGALMAIGYTVIGRLQAQFPPYFKTSLPHYCVKAERIFDHAINPIVE